MNNMKKTTLLLLLGPLAASPFACSSRSEPTGAPEEVAEDQARFATGPKTWPANASGWFDVPVCWEAATLANGSWRELRNTIRSRAMLAWSVPSRVTFTGWAACGVSTAGTVVVRIAPSGPSDADGIGYLATGPRTLTFGADRWDWDFGAVEHVFGLALGIPKENDRADWSPGWGARCGSTATRPTWADGWPSQPDTRSVMATIGADSSGRCVLGASRASELDVIGVQRRYGRRLSTFTSVASWQPGFTPPGDPSNWSWQNDTGRPAPATWSNGYVFSASDGYPGLVSLDLFYNAELRKYAVATTGSPNRVRLYGYAYQGSLGGVLTAPLTDMFGVVNTLRQFYDPATNSWVAIGDWTAQEAARSAGMVDYGVEGYTLSPLPYTMLETWWSEANRDRVTKRLGIEDKPLLDRGYVFAGLDVPVLAVPLPGAVRLDQYWGEARKDYFLLATSASRSTALANNYVASTGLAWALPYAYKDLRAPIKSFFSRAQMDFLTTGSPTLQASAAAGGYTLTRIEAYGFDPVSPAF